MSVLTPEQEEHFEWYAEISYDDPESDVYVLRLQTVYNFFYIIENLGVTPSDIEVEYSGCISSWYGGQDSDCSAVLMVGLSKISMYIARPKQETVYHNGLVAEFDFDKFRPLLASLPTSE